MPVQLEARRILMCGPIPPHPGGGAIGRGQLAAAFARCGREVAVLAPITREEANRGDRYAADHPEVQVVRYTLSSFEKLPFRPPDPSFVQEERLQVEPLFRALASEFRPDVVVVGRETFARYIPKLTEELGLPSVLLVRGSPTGHILRGEYPPDAADGLLREFRRTDRIIAVAEYLAEGLRRLGTPNVTAIPNAIDTVRFARAQPERALREQLGIEQQQRVILAPANLHPRKRPEDVLAAAKELTAQRRDVVFVMAGVGVGREEAQERVRSWGLESFFRFPGWVDYGQMPALMNLADIVVMASEAEGMARAYLEAMASERLLIASDIDAARELIVDGDNGLLFPLGDWRSLAALISEALDDSTRSTAIGRRARATVVDRSVENVQFRYLEELDRVVAERFARA